MGLTFKERFTDGTYWENQTMMVVPAGYLYEKASLDLDCKEATDQQNLYDRISVRTRNKPNDAFYEKIKYDFTMRLHAENGHTTEFEKIMYGNQNDAIIYSFHDETKVLGWFIINLKVLREAWAEWLVNPNMEPFFSDQKNKLDNTPFRAFNIKKIGRKDLVVAYSPGYEA